MADHVAAGIVGLAPVIVGDVLGCRDDDVANSRPNFLAHVAEPAGSDSLVPGQHPGTLALRRSPGIQNRLALVRVESRLEMQLEASRIARDVANPGHLGRIVAEKDVRERRYVDDPVISRKECSLAWYERGDERGHGRVDIFERLGPTIRLPAVRVGGHVELRHVDVAESSAAAGELRGGGRETVRYRCGRDVVGSPQHSVREAGIPVAARADRRDRYPLLRRLLEDRWHPLPGFWRHVIRPARELVGDPVRIRDEGGVSDDAMLAGGRAG